MKNMPRSKIEAFFLEFPWLSRFVEISPELQISVQRVDFERYKQIVIEDRFGHLCLSEHVYALDEDGNILGQVGHKKLEKKPSIWKCLIMSYCDLYLNGEKTLEDLFARPGFSPADASRVRFVVSVSIHDTPSVIIYKAPKGMTIQAYIEQEIGRARREVRAEVDQAERD